MKSGERRQGENPHLSENGAFGLRKPSRGELRARATEIAYVEFAESPGSPPEITDTEHAVVLRDGSVLKGRVIDMAHVMHDESSDYVVRFRTRRERCSACCQRRSRASTSRPGYQASLPGADGVSGLKVSAWPGCQADLNTRIPYL